MSVLSWENGAIRKPSPDLFLLFLNTSYTSESAPKTGGITKLLTPVLWLHPKRQTQGPKKRFMVDNHGGQCSTFLKTEQNRATAPQQSKPLRDSDSQLSCCIPHQGGIGEDGSFWHRIEATKLFPGGAALGQPGSLQGLKLSSMCPMSTATVSLLLHFLCALTRPSGFLNFS